MADEEKKLVKDFPIRGIGASAGGDEFTQVRGTMCTQEECGGWGKNLSNKPYMLADRGTNMGVKSEKLGVAEAMAVKDAGLCIHGELPGRCPHRKPGEATCRVTAKADGGGNLLGF